MFQEILDNPAQSANPDPSELQVEIAASQERRHEAHERIEDTLEQQAYNKRQADRRSTTPLHPLDVAGNLGLTPVMTAVFNAAERKFDRGKLKRADKADAKLYRQHPDEYVEAAVNDANKAGVKLNGWDQK